MTIARETLTKFLAPGDAFYETGTRWGDTVIKAFELQAAEVYSCEMDPKQWSMAVLHVADAAPRFKGKYQIFNMEAIDFLCSQALKAPPGSVVFLDAHTDTYSPVLGELDMITRWPNRPKTILVDDMRCITAWGVKLADILKPLETAGYSINYEDGIVANDILVARL